MPKHIVVPDEREKKLVEIAASHNVTVAEAVGLLLNWAIEAGKVQPGIPGIEVRRVAETVEIDFGDFVRVMPLGHAKGFASAIGIMVGPHQTFMHEGVKMIAQIDEGGERYLGLKRRGNSVKVLGENGEERTLAPSVALDLAALVKAAAE
ncbi:hypothetical protein JP75_14305 [Devosia riboflavina]|uniref:Uncharacterized protein n=1 Tax=Devosia riboflavina TaxID=46914 RepID=A0A087M190_9HYPH|nr:hypothetical protein [Devosia riboflavina]KFL30643.1 hypothetical protein JP75_14305 [Devosia riboflavina]